VMSDIAPSVGEPVREPGEPPGRTLSRSAHSSPFFVRRTLEHSQDVIVSLLMVLLLVLSLQALWRIARMALIEEVGPPSCCRGYICPDPHGGLSAPDVFTSASTGSRWRWRSRSPSSAPCGK